MRKIYLAIATLLIAAVCSTSAQNRDLQQTDVGTRPAEALVFKPIPGDPKNRMAEFTTPAGVRMRAVTDGPDSIHFTAVDQAQMPMDIYLHGARVVERLSGGVGASIDLFSTKGAFGSALGHLTGKKVSGCKTTITITIGEDGSIHTTMQIECSNKA